MKGAGYVCSYYSNDRFFCASGSMNKKDADLHCRNQDLVLPIVKDFSTGHKILKHCGIKDHAFWVDAERVANGRNYKWSTGTVLDNKDPIWHSWNPDYDGRCVEWFFWREGGQWALNDIHCTAHRRVVCEERTRYEKTPIIE